MREATGAELSWVLLQMISDVLVISGLDTTGALAVDLAAEVLDRLDDEPSGRQDSIVPLMANGRAALRRELSAAREEIAEMARSPAFTAEAPR